MIKIIRVELPFKINCINTVSELLNSWRCLLLLFPFFRVIKIATQNEHWWLWLTDGFFAVVAKTSCLTRIDTDLLIYQIRERSVITCPSLILSSSLQSGLTEIFTTLTIHYGHGKKSIWVCKRFSPHYCWIKLSWTLQKCHLASVHIISYTVLYSVKVL